VELACWNKFEQDSPAIANFYRECLACSQMFKICLLSACAAAVMAKIEFPRMIGRGLQQMTFAELPFPQGDVQHQVAVSGSVDVDGRPYTLEYVAFELHNINRPQWSQICLVGLNVLGHWLGAPMHHTIALHCFRVFCQHSRVVACVDVQQKAIAGCRYAPVARSGKKVGDNYFGWLTDMNGEGLMLDGEKFISNGAGALLPISVLPSPLPTYHFIREDNPVHPHRQ
jgi:hypothetical protein